MGSSLVYKGAQTAGIITYNSHIWLQRLPLVKADLTCVGLMLLCHSGVTECIQSLRETSLSMLCCCCCALWLIMEMITGLQDCSAAATALVGSAGN